MAKKTVGFVELEWTCKRCGTKNPGTIKTCTNCGSPMAEGDTFDLPDQQALITDPSKLAEAGEGPDFHCPYCSARNPAGSETCTQCGGDLKEAKAREKGSVLGAFQAGPAPEVACPSCSTLNPSATPRCKNCGASLQRTQAVPSAANPAPAKTGSGLKLGMVIGVGVVLLLCIGLFAILALASRTNAATATVQSVQWERNIQILEERPVEHQDWKDQIPSGSPFGACTQKIRRTQSEPAPGAEEVCGTPYTVDQGDGLGEVVQDCEYNIYDQWCSYTAMEWQGVDSEVTQGNNLSPFWPTLSLTISQREGERSEDYAVTFLTDGEGKTYIYRLDDPNAFAQFAAGSRWELEINGLGSITEIQPK